VNAPVATTAIAAALQSAGLLVETIGALPDAITRLTDDSREVVPGAAFVAVRGSAQDGHAYLPAAAQAGMALAIVEDATGVAGPALVVRDARQAAAVAAAAVHGHPGAELSIVGVTGTSGKTTVASMLRHLLDREGAPSASLGTLGVLVGSAGTPLPGGAGLTTPGPIELQRVLRALVTVGVRTVVMEVSSHALAQHRIAGVTYACAVFTNLSRDHLDYHGTMEEYLGAKARLVTLLAEGGAAVVNADVDTWRRLPPVPRTVRYGTGADADVRAMDIRFGEGGSRWRLVAGGSRADVTLPLIGDFNVSNALAASAAAWSLGGEIPHIAGRFGTLPQVPGRLERIHDRPAIIRDYAHKPDALERALLAVRPFTEHRLIVVFGCGGDRDRGKRPIMGAIAERLADVVILTSDNPRTEDPERILDEIETGMTRPDHERIEDRRQAIARAMAMAGPGDLIVLAGKGHETYQVRGTTAFPFDERDVVREIAGQAVTG
jgi:UDP-N-acetylmuramoyl-L-alanyl-D-glutamate--2,6-diaminopimelate ligase